MISSYSRNLLIINGAALMGCAVFDFAWQQKLLTVMLLFLPFLDRDWTFPAIRPYRYQWILLSVIFVLTGLLSVQNPEYIEPIIFILFFTAIPEEWFFRSYFMQRLELLGYGKWIANGIASLLFATLHIPIQGLYGLSVFIPSLVFGWLYQRNRDIVLVILLHTFFNGIYIIYLHDMLN